MAETRRRKPRQDRSRATVERIVDAATRVLSEVGYPQASTNRIAAEAGVSPGSLYQYFTGKDELVAAVAQRLVVDFAEGVTPALRRAAVEDLETGTRIVLHAILDVLEGQAEVLRVLVERVPAVEQEEALGSLRARVTDFVFHMLAGHRTTLRPEELDRATWAIVEIAQHMPVRYVLDRPPISREDFVEDVSRIVLHLAQGRPA